MSMGFRASAVGDYCYYDASGVVLRVGGYYSQNRYLGLFFLVGVGAASFQSVGIGSLVLVFLIDGYGGSLNHRWVEISHTSW
jgi:hypothetical protein